MPDQRNGVSEMAEQVQGSIVETAQTVKDTAADFGAQAKGYAREAGRQASAAARNAYGASGSMIDTVESFTRQNIWSSLLIAAAVGYGAACLIKNTRGV
jgi:ElaB/YqjD/DUF883 family membrane-anchored ribosome-binding protein